MVISFGFVPARYFTRVLVRWVIFPPVARLEACLSVSQSGGFDTREDWVGAPPKPVGGHRSERTTAVELVPP